MQGHRTAAAPLGKTFDRAAEKEAEKIEPCTGLGASNEPGSGGRRHGRRRRTLRPAAGAYRRHRER